MKIEDQDIELIRRYHEFDLDPSELSDMKNRMESESQFAKNVDQMEYVRNSIIELSKDNLEKKFQTPPVIKPYLSQNNQTKKWMGYFALILITVSAALIITNIYDKYNNFKILAECEKYTFTISQDVLRGLDDNFNIEILSEKNKDALGLIIQSYESGEFAQAEMDLLELQKTITKSSEEEIIMWWLATIQLKQNKQKEARQTLESILNNADFNSSSKANGLLGN